MSLARGILEAVDLNVNVQVHGSLLGQSDALVIQDDTGTTNIIGVLDSEPQIIPEFDFDVDPRELARLEVHNKNEVQGTFNGVTRYLDYNDIILQGQNHYWRVLRRNRNPAQWFTEYWLVKKTSGDA